MKKLYLIIFLNLILNCKAISSDSLIAFKGKLDTILIKLSQETSKVEEQNILKNYAVPIVSVLSAIGAFIGVFLQVRANNKAKEKELQDKKKYEIIKVYSELISSLDLTDINIMTNLSIKNHPSILFFQKKIILLSLLKNNSNVNFSTFEVALNKYSTETLDTKTKASKWIELFSNEFYTLTVQL